MSDISNRLAGLSPEKRELLLQQLRDRKEEFSGPQIERQKRDTNTFPLSFAQERLWFLDQLEPDSSTYNITSTYRLKGPLNVAVLEQSLNEIVQRHEILRTTFSVVDGQPVQIIMPGLTLSISIKDLRNLAEADQEAQTQKLMSEERKRTFELDQGPLLYTTLLRLDEQNHILLLTIHHIIFDGWSTGVLFQELSILYKAFSTGKAPSLPELPIQYADYAVRQREWLQGEVLKTQLDYWKQQLGNLPSPLELPTDRPRPAVQTHHGAMQSMTLPKDLTEALQALSRQEGGTLFMTLLAAFKVLLYRYSGQEDISIGSPIANRQRSEIQNLVGVFLNTLVLRTDLSGAPGFRELLNRVQNVALDAYTHQDIPFEKILEELQPERDLSRTPLFQVFFNMQQYTTENQDLDLHGITAEHLTFIEPDSKFDLTMYVQERNKELHFQLVYNVQLFDHDRMIMMLDQFNHLLRQIVENPGSSISQFSLISPTIKQILPNPRHTLQTTWQGAVHDQFSQQADQLPEHLAIVDPQESWTYQILEVRSNQLAHYLLANGIEKRDVVAVYGHRNASLICTVLGILKAGAAFMILNPAHPALRLIDCLDGSKPQGWVQLEAAGPLPDQLETYVANLSPRCTLTLPSTVSEIGDLLENYSTGHPGVEVGPDDLAYIAFTSGSTGQPKGIMGRHGPLSHFLPWQIEKFDLTSSDRFSMLSGLSHDPLQRDIFTALWVGGTICIPGSDILQTPDMLANWVAQADITFAHLTPPMAQILTGSISLGQRLLSTLRYVFFVGDKLTQSDVIRLRRLAPEVTCINSYGSTETQRAVSYHIISPEQESLKAVYHLGRGMPDVQLLVLNSDQQLAGMGELGEIYIRSPHLAQGYVDDEALTQARFLTNPFTNKAEDRMYRTGDLGRYLPDGNVEFAGRSDGQVKIRGFRIELGEIETVLDQQPTVGSAVVVAHESIPGDKRLIAYITTNQPSETVIRESRSYLKQKLPDYMIPSTFVVLDKMPLTPNGKVDYRSLPLPDLVRQEPQEGYIAPRDELELQLTKIWENILNVQPIGVRDNFFDLGGYSLLAVRLFAQLEKVFGKNLPLATLFQAPTIEQLVEILHDEGWQAPWASLVPIQPQGSKPPFFCVHAVGGNVLSLRDLAQHLGTDQPFYALQSQGLNGKERPPARVEEMAAYYIEEIRTVQPEGPYYLGGQSSGGLIAFEMAQQLQAQGKQVAILALIDTYDPLDRKLSITVPFRNKVSFHLRAFSQLGSTYVLEWIKYRIKKTKFELERSQAAVIKKIYTKLEKPMPQRIRYTYVREIIRQAVKDYTPQSYEGRITLFRATNTIQAYLEDLQGSQQRWSRLAIEGLDTYDIDGAHNLEQEPYIGVLAEKLSACICNAQVTVSQQKVPIDSLD